MQTPAPLPPPSTAASLTASAAPAQHAGTADAHFSLDLDALSAILPEELLRKGVAAANAHRVISVELHDALLRGTVEDDDDGEQLAVAIHAEEGGLRSVCACGGAADLPLCAHAVALLLAHSTASSSADAAAASALQEALGMRRGRAKREVLIERLREGGGASVWSAQSLVSSAGASPTPGRRHRVMIYAMEPPVHDCTCPDFAGNQLGSCKHIEAALDRLRKPNSKLRPRVVDRPVVWLDWSGEAPQLRVLLPSDGPLRESLLPALGHGLTLPEPWLPALDALEAAWSPAPGLQWTADVAALRARRRAEPALAARRAGVEAAVRATGGRIPGVTAQLYPYQVEGVAFLASRGRALLADDMGLGKTLQTIAAAQWLRVHDGVRQVLVVTPTSLKRQWQDELRRFLGVEAAILEGNPSTRQAIMRRRPPFLIANYELVVRELSQLRDHYPPDLVVLDEAQRIKNWRTRTAAAIKAIPSEFAFVLTGTPLENRLEDLYSLLQVVDPRVLGPLWRFELDHAVKDERGKLVGYRNLSGLRRRIAPVMLRRERAIVRDQLPERVVNERWLALTERQRELHDGAIRNATQIQVEADKQHRPLTPFEEKRFLSLLQAARMACDAAGLLDGTTESSPKLEELGSLLQELCLDGGEKVVVFSQWERMTAMAEAVARGLGLGTARLHGGVSARARGELVTRFREDPGCQVFISTDAGGTGLNLQHASWLINLDLPWNPAVLDQRLGRIHRLGQRRTANIVLLLAAESYEARVAAILGSKRALFGASISGAVDVDSLGIDRGAIAVAMAALRALGVNALTGERRDEQGAGEGTAAQDGLDAAALEAAVAAEDAAALADEQAAVADGAAVDDGAAGVAAESAAGSGRAVSQIEAFAPRVSPLEALLPVSDDGLGRALAALSSLLGARLVRVLVTAGGLCAIVRKSEAGDADAAAAIDPALPIAVVDEQTFAALRRLGHGSPLADARVVHEAVAPAVEDALTVAAARKLRGAIALMQAGALPEAMALCAEALLASYCGRDGRQVAVTRDEAAAYLFTEAVPRGVCTLEQATLALRADGLAKVATLPEALAAEVLAEVRALLG